MDDNLNLSSQLKSNTKGFILSSHQQVSATMATNAKTNDTKLAPLPFNISFPSMSMGINMTQPLADSNESSTSSGTVLQNHERSSPITGSNNTSQDNTTVAVNGFHPRSDLSRISKVNNDCSLKTFVPSKKVRKLDEEISNLVSTCREDEIKNCAKRQRCSSYSCSLSSDQILELEILNGRTLVESGSTLVSSEAELWTEFFQESTVPQLITNTAGRGIECNAEFLQICGASLEEPSSSFTILNLVQPSMLPKLFGIFSMALDEKETANRNETELCTSSSNIIASHDSPEPVSLQSKDVLVSITDDDEEEEEDEDEDDLVYTCTTLPCVSLPASELSHYITIVLMDDVKLEKRCFLCILSSSPSLKPAATGEIRYLSHDDVLELL